MTHKKEFSSFEQVKTGEDLAKFSVERGAEIHDSRKGTKVVFPDRGSFLVNTTKELSKHDKSHFRKILRILGIISTLLLGVTFVAAFLQALANIFGYQIIWL